MPKVITSEQDPSSMLSRLLMASVHSKNSSSFIYNTENRDISEASKAALPVIEECLAENVRKRESGRSKQQMRKIDIYHYLKKNGYKISYSTVKRLIRNIDKRSREAYIHQIHNPGDETEFDWGEVKLDIGGTGYAKYQMAVFSSAYGNHRFARLYRTQDTAAFQESHVDYFTYCKGVYRTVVYDNMKVAVADFVGPTEKEPTADMRLPQHHPEDRKR